MVPNGWEIQKLEQIATVERGKFSARPRNDPKYFGGNIPFVQTGDIAAAKTYLQNYTQTLNEDGLKVSRLFPKNTILITIAANIGDTAITSFDVACPDSLVAIRTHKDTDCFWLKLYLETCKDELDGKATQNAQKNINLQVLKPLEVLTPPYSEQRKIAQILSTWDRGITTTEKLINASKQQKKALMQQLLTGKKRLVDPETGKAFEGDWEEVKLDDISTITRLAGAEYSDIWETKDNGEIIALRGFNIGQNKLIFRDLERIDNQLSLKLSRSRLNKNDIVFPCVGSIGKACLIREDDKFHINQNIAKITPKSVVPLFLTFCLLSKRAEAQILQFNTSSSQPNVLVGNLRKFKFILPVEVKEQQKIASVLTAADKDIELLETKLEHFKQEKKALMQQLLTGKRRVSLSS
ncbi:restriction endonuclease subunit S [Vibrio scophthalmi]|uniref:restriction endonuclease subunit S n=1 Tax=Vibrio scophthalmi TaxID=45658 RepID=UPI003AB00EC1